MLPGAERQKRKSLEGQNVENVDDDSATKWAVPRTITVSMTCILDTVQQLHVKRQCHEKLVQSLINTLALVMNAVRMSTGRETDDSSSSSSSTERRPASWPVDHANYPLGDPRGRGKIFHLADHEDLNVSDQAFHAGRIGSPFRENFLDAGSKDQKSLRKLNSFSALLRKDSRLNICDVPSSWRKGIYRSAENLLSVETAASLGSGDGVDGDVFQTAAAARGLRSNPHSPMHLRSSSSSHSDSGHSGFSFSEEVRSSASLRESMERDRVQINSLQYRIRDAAEKDNLQEMHDLIAQREELAQKALQEVTSMR